MELERRAAIELRADGRRLVGYAAVFNSPAQIGDFRETIKPGAFRSALSSGKDVLALVDHDPSRLLARTKSGTLRLSEDVKGLSFDILVPSTSLGADVLAMVERGDIGGCSFGFIARGEQWQGEQRTLTDVELHEISIVHAWPAYDATSVSARHRQTYSREDVVTFRKRLLAVL